MQSSRDKTLHAKASPDGAESLHLPQPRQWQRQKEPQDHQYEEYCDDVLIKNNNETLEEEATHGRRSQLKQGRDDHDDGGEEVGPRERLKRHRREMGGHVWIPDMWGQEDFLKDWVDCTAFDASLLPHTHNLMLARASLMQETGRARAASLTIENSC